MDYHVTFKKRNKTQQNLDEENFNSLQPDFILATAETENSHHNNDFVNEFFYKYERTCTNLNSEQAA